MALDLKCEILFLSLHSNSGASGCNATSLTAAVSCEGKGHCYSTGHNYILRDRSFLSTSSTAFSEFIFWFFDSFIIFATFALCIIFFAVAVFLTFHLWKSTLQWEQHEFSLARQLGGSRVNHEIKLIIREQGSGATATQHKALSSIDTFEPIGCIGDANLANGNRYEPNTYFL